MAFNNNAEIIKFENATDTQKQKKSEFKYQMAAALSALLIGGTAIASAVTNADANTQAPETGVENTIEDNNTNLHEEVGQMFAQKLNTEVGEQTNIADTEPAPDTTVNTTDVPVQQAEFMSTPMEEKLAQTQQPVEENVEGRVVK